MSNAAYKEPKIHGELGFRLSEKPGDRIRRLENIFVTRFKATDVDSPKMIIYMPDPTAYVSGQLYDEEVH